MTITAHGTPQSTYPGNAQTGVVVTVGDLIVVEYSYSNTNQSPACTDNAAGGTNSYTPVIDVGNSGASTAAHGHKFWANAKASETLTVTCTAETDNGIHVNVYTASNGFPASPVDGTPASSSEASAGTAHTSGSTTPGAGDSIVVACFWFEETLDSTLTENGTGFTKQTEHTNHVSAFFDQIIGSASGSAINDAVTSSVSTFYNSIIAAFKENAAASGGGAIFIDEDPEWIQTVQPA